MGHVASKQQPMCFFTFKTIENSRGNYLFKQRLHFKWERKIK